MSDSENQTNNQEIRKKKKDNQWQQQKAAAIITCIITPSIYLSVNALRHLHMDTCEPRLCGFRHFHGTQVGQTKLKDFVPLNLGSLTTVLSIFFSFYLPIFQVSA